MWKFGNQIGRITIALPGTMLRRIVQLSLRPQQTQRYDAWQCAVGIYCTRIAI